jgi:hypothetical protein
MATKRRITTPAQSRATASYHQRMKHLGFVQSKVWVPQRDVAYVQRIAEGLRDALTNGTATPPLPE